MIAEVRVLKAQPCADCNHHYPYYVMDFDHREGEEKKGVINRMIAMGWARQTIMAEIAKCDVVCANCHRERTHQRKEQQKALNKAAKVDSDI